MSLSSSVPAVCVLLGFFAIHSATASGQGVLELGHDIPVAYDVDVVVVGGSSGAVSAAVQAAAQGADVFLAAPRPYLGEDLCGTYRLWLGPGEEPDTPLAQAVFAEPPVPIRVGPSLPFTYQADLASGARHPDTDPPSMLADGKGSNAYNESVQYDGDVTIVAKLPEPRHVGRVHVLAFQRNNDIEVASVAVASSLDGQTWADAGTAVNEQLGQGECLDAPLYLTLNVARDARYVKVHAKKTARVDRILLGEIVIEPETVGESASDRGRVPPMPMQVKRVLDQALLDAGVAFLFGCYPTDVLCDAEGELAGIVMANRSGRQAVLAPSIIDATPRATVARLAGASFQAYPSGVHTFERTVVGGQAPDWPAAEVHKLPTPVQAAQGTSRASSFYDAIRYMLRISMDDASFVSFAKAEQMARDRTWTAGQVAASEMLFQIPPDPVEGQATVAGAWPGAEEVDLAAFRPAGLERLYVLGGCADVSRAAAAELLRPLTFIAVGARVGKAAAKETGALEGVHLPASVEQATVAGDVRAPLGGVRTVQADRPAVRAGARALPVLGEYDVVVVGGGTGGAPAGIAAARQGAKTLVVEYLYGLGGVGTLGLIGKYYHGYRGGFTAEIDRGVDGMAGFRKNDGSWDVEVKMEWLRRELRQAGADIWFGTLGCGAVVEGDTVKGAVVATPDGRGVVLAKVVIDSTGNADVAAAAGASCIYTDGSHVAVQGTGMPPRRPGATYTNTDYTLADDGDVVDMWRTFVAARDKYKAAYDLGQLIDTRERRRIVGDFVLSPLDIYNRRTFPDTIGLSTSNFDTHGFTIHPFFALKPPDKGAVSAYTPYRCLVPKEVDGILVTGLGISAHRDAMPILRMQPDIQNQGYAAGVAAAMAARENKRTRDIDVNALQRHLVEVGCLPETVLSDRGSYPLPHEAVATAVARAGNDYDGIGVILAAPKAALPLLEEAYKRAQDEGARRIYAHILGMMGDAAGTDALVASVASQDWDSGWSFTGGGQFGASLSPLDSLIIALARTGDRAALEPIHDKAAALGPEHPFSHHRAVAVALETLVAPEAAPTLAALLSKPGMMGHAVTDIGDAKEQVAFADPNLSRELSLRELILARALFRCGDHEGLGERILTEYARDLRGHHARHARAVLAEKPNL